MVNTVKVEMMVPKEAKEVVDFISDLLKDILAKKNAAVIAAENLPALMGAVDGYALMGDELKSEYKDELAAYLVMKIWDALQKEEVAPAPEAPQA